MPQETVENVKKNLPQLKEKTERQLVMLVESPTVLEDVLILPNQTTVLLTVCQTPTGN